MRQVFLGTPWVHRPASPKVVQFINENGRWMKLPAGGSIFNGGDAGEVALVLSGLGAFSFQDSHGANHIFSLIMPGRIMGDVDAFALSMVNVVDSALRDTEVRLMHREVFMEFLQNNPDVQAEHSKGMIADHESDMEGMIANYTLSAPQRLTALFESLVVQAKTPCMGGWYELPYQLRVTEISKIVSVARPTVSTILAAWQKEGEIRKEGQAIYISKKLIADNFDWTRHGATPSVHIRKSRKSNG